jgi:hypothetical protein
MAAVGVLALTACSGVDQERSDSPTGPVVFKPGPPSACSFRDARGYVSDYFTLVADRKTANDFLKVAEGLEGTARNAPLFEVMKLISTKRADGQVGAASAGASLILEIADCGSFVISHNDASIAAVLTEALANGAFAYRAGTEGFVSTVDGGSALWTADWDEWIGGPAMAFGAKWTTSFGNEALVGTFSYRWGLIYGSDAHGPQGNGNDDIAAVELCESGVEYTEDPRYRVGRVRANGTKTVLQLADIDGFCPTTLPPSGGIVSRVLRGVVGFFAPTPLQARRRAPPGMSGGLDDLSDILGVNALAVSLAFATQPVDGSDTAPFLVEVYAATAGGNDFEDVPVTVAVAGNQGIPAGATLTPVAGCGLSDTTPSLTERTNELGIASFCVMVNKPGGYTLEASHDLAGFAPTVVLSDQFNRTP